ncbi:heme exporter protein CcmB [Temperatibacter marinus]|uniref:Heme exporter protein B n=1 Tax=Temperatibacter marinus TaxID=1456591 RepID=A0AA52H9D1_9PROT|nr:heme exporter protein CcmB [Temperatibacter marinus]WND03066.1 heme exporter protein CcmB [Temperatibacter marinus]
MTSPSLSYIFSMIFKRDTKLAWSQGGSGTLGLSFFLIASSLFPFGIGADPNLLQDVSVSIIWIMALLAGLLSLDRLYQVDFEDGTLEEMMISPIGVTGVIIAKSLAHWVNSIVPLILFAPLLGVLYFLPDQAFGALILSLLVGSPALSFIGSIGASLTLAVKRGGVLLALIILPLYIPTLIFGASVVKNAISGLDYYPELSILGAVTLVSMVIAPIASKAALKLALE